jgi:hypothetical protein
MCENPIVAIVLSVILVRNISVDVVKRCHFHQNCDNSADLQIVQMYLLITKLKLNVVQQGGGLDFH